MDKQRVRRLILDEALRITPFEGWTEPMLKRAAAQAGFSDIDLARVFETIPEVLAFWSTEADNATVHFASTAILSEMKIRERIAHLVMFRLNYFLPHREAFRRAHHTLFMPWNALHHFTSLTKTIDTIWRLAGDQSTDYNWYSKRVLLAGVYLSTLRFWLNDHSDDLQDTKLFLARRIAEVLKIGGGFSRFIKRAA